MRFGFFGIELADGAQVPRLDHISLYGSAQRCPIHVQPEHAL
jgi:hypothetical protein